MLDGLFLSVLNMSIAASLVILVVLLVRLLLKKAPKIFSYALWAVVLFRLICPFSFESAIGLLPINKTPIPHDIAYQAQPQVDTGINIVDNMVNPMLPIPNNAENSVNPLQIWVFVGSAIWAIGMLAMLLYSIIQFVRLKKKLIGATPLQDNIYLADHITSPFVMGFIKPHIYLPSSMAKTEQAFIIAHEQYHIKRFDHIARILGFIALTIHWFNPLAWLAFVLSGKDMEMSCDEAVMRKMDTDIRVEYSKSLLRFATGRKFIAATPLAFGEGDTKDRVKNVMQYKKPILWVSIIAVIAVVCVVVGFMSNPKSEDRPPALYAYYENGFIPMTLGTYSWDGVAADAISYTEREYETMISFNDGTGLRYANIFLSTEKELPYRGINGEKDTIKIVEMKRYSNGKEEISDDFEDNMMLVSLADGVSYLYEFKVQFGENHAYYSIKINNNVADLNSSEPLTHDQAVTSALFSLSNQYLAGECIAEGHIILGYDDSDKNKTKIYALTTTSQYGFENDNFVQVSGSAFPAVITLNSDNTVSIQQPMDGSDYAKSIEKLFPKEYHDKVLSYDSSDQESMKQQEQKYASEYLSKIGRETKIGDYSDFEHTSLTDLGVSVEVSNNLQVFYKEHSYYPSFIGTRERLENGVRVVYEMNYEKNQEEIKFIKYNYDTKEIIEQFIASANTGEIID